MATRQGVRVQIASILYAYGIGNDGISEYIEEILEEKKIKNKKKEYAYSLYNGVMENIQDIDKVIFLYVEERLAKKVGYLEKAILRLLSYEILYTDTNKIVCINEGVEITKDLCGEKSSKFINAILEKISKHNETTDRTKEDL